MKKKYVKPEMELFFIDADNPFLNNTSNGNFETDDKDQDPDPDYNPEDGFDPSEGNSKGGLWDEWSW